MTYSGSTSMIGDHGGFAHDDTNVMLLVANPSFTAQTVSDGTTTTQVAPTIVKALGLSPSLLDAVRIEGTPVLPEVVGTARKVIGTSWFAATMAGAGGCRGHRAIGTTRCGACNPLSTPPSRA